MARQVSKIPSHAWGFNPSKQQPELLQAWKTFIQTGKIETEIVPSHIAESWVRSRYYGVDPFRISSQSYLSPDKYQKKIQENHPLISLSTPILENVFKSFGAARYVVALYDKDGYHLIRLAQPEDLRLREKYGFRKGLCFDERHVGTCGFALAKKLKRVTRVIGCENYLSLLHRAAGVYSPILDSETKQVIGVIAVTGASLVQYPQAESIVIAASTAIENLLELDKAQKELFIYSRSLQFTIDFLEDGVIVVDNQGCIYEMNLAARQALGLSREDVRTRHISELPQFAPLKEIVMESLRFPDQKEGQTEFQVRSQTYLVKVRGVRKAEDDLLGVLVQMKNVRDLTRIFHSMAADQPKHTIDHLVGSSKSTREVRNLIRIASQSDVPVIIEGESGTGKEVVAQAIHNAGSRRGKPFVAVNCAAIPFDLLESTVFGHEKGAFTGAVSTHMGKFELANGGTLFLDEIADMPINMQAKMLRAIEDRRIERVGGHKPIPIDVRILSASNKNLFAQVQKHLFREDLFFRLNVFRIELPPLRDRKEDLVELVHLFLEEFSPVFGKGGQKISPECMTLLSQYDWPGNIRELRNAIQFSLARSEGDTLSPVHFQGFFQNPPEASMEMVARGKTLQDMERQIILKTLKSHNHNKSKTAQALGIGRCTLYRKLKTHSN